MSPHSSTQAGAPPRPDFYTFIHKSLRALLFRLATDAASADFTDEATMLGLQLRLDRVLGHVRAHARHEEAFLHPALVPALADEAHRLDKAHAEHERALDSLAHTFARVRSAHAPEAGRAFLRELNGFVSVFLAHLNDEEDLAARMASELPEAALQAAMAAFQASRTPEDIASDLELMLPTLNRQDRASLLGGLRAASSFAFAQALKIARRVLEANAYSALVTDVGAQSSLAPHEPAR